LTTRHVELVTLPRENFQGMLVIGKTFIRAAALLAFAFTASAQAQYALNFDGVNDRVDGTNTNLPQGNAPRTFEAWVNPTSVSGAHTVFSYGNFTNLQRAGMLIVNGHLYWVGEVNDVSGIATIPTGVWTHVAISYDGTNVNLYVNGVLDVSAPLPNGPAQTTGFEWSMSNTSGDPATREPFAGEIDEVKVWNVARSAADIRADLNNCAGWQTASLVAYYRLDDGPNSATASDSSASNSPGTLVNMDTAAAWVADTLPQNANACQAASPVAVPATSAFSLALLALLLAGAAMFASRRVH
jgi:hypothetical protein